MQKPRSNSGPAGVAAPPATRTRHPVEPPSTSLVSSPLVYTRESSSGPDRSLQLSFAGSPLDGAVSEHPELPTYRAPCMPIRPPCFQEGSHSRARPQRGGVMTPKSGVMFLKNSPLCRGHVSENGVGNVSEKHALKWGHDPDKSHLSASSGPGSHKVPSAIRTLAQVRRLLLPPFQVKIGTQQVNAMQVVAESRREL